MTDPLPKKHVIAFDYEGKGTANMVIFYDHGEDSMEIMPSGAQTLKSLLVYDWFRVASGVSDAVASKPRDLFCPITLKRADARRLWDGLVEDGWTHMNDETCVLDKLNDARL
jgi:hypothetical protein